MCGIAGVVALREGLPPPPLEALQAMAAALRHRGPDEFGLYRDARAGLAHARLSIIDPLTGQQPLGSPDGRLWVVFNGEIFNYVELRAELAALGYRFATRSDTEVIVRAYEAWGERAFARFNGQFAIALWDSRNRSLVLARDRHGIQPLHLCERGGRLWFASEVKALFAGDPSLPRRFDPLGLAETFTFWSVVPPQSVFQGIEELRPGHVRTLSARGSTECAFWSPRYPAPGEGFRGSIDEAAERVRAALEEAVRQRVLRADVPVGSYLSGGLDSSLIAALARRANRGRFLTFSIRFADAEYDETPYQRAAAALIGSDRGGWTGPGFAHQTRWRSTAALQRLFQPGFLPKIDVVERLLADLPAEFRSWAPLAQDQYLETRTLLAGYLLASQGDRMLMAHSGEGRVPYLDDEVVELANSLPARYKLRGLDEKHVLKRAATGLVPDVIVRRPKQPYRAPNAAAFAGADTPDWAAELMGAPALADAGVFEPRLVEKLWRKCRDGGAAPFSNADDMALAGVLSTQLLHAQLIRQAPPRVREPRFRTRIDRLAQPVVQ